MAQSVFSDSHRYAVVDAPFSGELGDVDGDNHLDYVVTNYYSNSLSVFHGAGNGTLTPLSPVTVAHNPRGLALGDLNGDGSLDAVVTLPSAGQPATPGQIQVLFGDGTGGFTGASLHSAGGFPVWVEVGHLNGDGLLDIAVGNQATNDVSVLLATGPGTFGAATNYNTGGYSSEEIALGDIEGDGDIDIVVGSWLDSRVVSLLGDGTGSYSLGGSAFANNPKSIALADMNGNGRLDLVTVSSGADVVQVFPASAGGTYSTSKSVGVGEYPAGVAVADMNMDGRPDVVASAVSGMTISLLVGTGSGELSFAIDSPASHSPWHLVAGDLNGDGIPDLVVTEVTLDHVSVYLGDGVGSYSNYCTAKVNSLGCLPRIIAHGAPSLSNIGPFHITVDNLRSSQMAMFIYKVGGAQADVPFQGGTLCVGPNGIRRTPVKNTGGYPANGLNCTGLVGMNFNKFALGLAGGNPHPGLMVPGNTYRVQLWGRDGNDPFGTTLSSAVEVSPWL